MSLCDIHQHVVFGVDDGSPDIETSREMLRSAFNQGVMDIVCTSHSHPGYRLFPKRQYMHSFSALTELVNAEFPGMRLYTGSEIMYSQEAVQALRNGQIPTLANSWYILVEFMPDMTIEILLNAATDFLMSGYKPIFAHIERYACLREEKNFDRLREMPVLLQMNANTVIGCKKLLCDRWAKRKIFENNIDIVASDAHNNTDRFQKLGEAYGVLKRLRGVEIAECLCYENPHTIVGIN